MAEAIELPSHLWRADLRSGLAERLGPVDSDVRLEGADHAPSALFLRDLKAVLPDRSIPSAELSKNPNIPRVKDIPISRQLSEHHPLCTFIQQHSPLTRAQYRQILHSPHIDLSITGFHTGSVPAAVHSRFLKGEELEPTDYANNEWVRDAILVSVACHRSGYTDLAHSVLKNVWHFLGSAEHRYKVVQFHLLTDEEAQAKFERGEDIPAVKLQIRSDGHLDWRNHPWGDAQNDANGAAIWTPFRFANQRHVGMSEYATRDYQGRPLGLHEIDPLYGTGEHILVAYLKYLNRIDVAHRSDYGPWEDRLAKSRASSVGIVNAAVKEAIIYHEREGWDALGAAYSDGQRPDWFKNEVLRLAARTAEVLNMRIPEYGIATECDQRPIDSAVLLLNYPFRGSLTEGQQSSVLAAGYENLRPEGIIRWKMDLEYGEDAYVGQDYNHFRCEEAKGEFADGYVPGFQPARWTMFDPIIAASCFVRFIESGGEDIESFLRGDRHIKRSLSQITKDEDILWIEGKQKEFVIPKGVLPEAYFWDSHARAHRPCHNSPLLMSQALFALALERAIEASTLLERKFHSKIVA
ncbi:MAG: hypothetical protein J5J00_16215 [Deltaproteobacteria bacterium]|nr:hypothetical protein [Deltaproteobacteria bacterium]